MEGVIDVRYVASTLSGALIQSLEPQTITLSVDNMNATAVLHNGDTSVNSISYITNNSNEVVVIGALWFDDGYDWFWLSFKAASKFIIQIDDLHKYFQNAFEQGAGSEAMSERRD